MPARLIIVESAANMPHFRLPDDEWRTSNTDHRHGERTSVDVEDGRLAPTTPSCRDIDGWDAVQELNLSNVRRITAYGKDDMYCDFILFDAEAADSPLTLAQAEEWGGPDVPIERFAWSTLSRTPARLQNTEAWGTVVFSPVTSRERTPTYPDKPLPNEQLYMTTGERGEPPVIIMRRWEFKNTPEAAEALAYLGIESDKDEVKCEDFYFGYFAE